MIIESNHNDTYPWWKKTTVYQIYPRSYIDSNGDGIGDLAGIISKLDYLKELGIETIWFSPFFKSPQQDFGYDISDYKDIAAEYGNFDISTQLIKEIHNRDLKVIFDLVLNHTSDQHPWFIESRSSLDNPKRDWYVWKDGRKPNENAPPNNWQSMTSGSGWHYDKHTDQWYWAAFLGCQPDLNYRNPDVKKEMFATVKYWLDKGVDGYRLDIIGSIFEDPKFRNNPRTTQFLPTGDDRGMLFRSSKMTINLEETIEFTRELRKLIDEYRDPPRFLIGEVAGTFEQLRNYCGGTNFDGLHSVFLFQTLGMKLSKKSFQKTIINFEKNFPEPLIPVGVFSNHDKFRRIYELGNNIAKAKLNLALQMTLRGIPVVYYGEEIGMHQHRKLEFRESLDPVSFKFKKFPNFISNIMQHLTGGSLSRDGCRTPMQWDNSPNAGFSSNLKTWLPVTPSFQDINVEAQIKDPNSLFHCYKKFLKLRKETPALHAGSIEILENNEFPKNILVYQRKIDDEDQTVIIFGNFSSKQAQIPNPFPNIQLLASTNNSTTSIGNNIITLEALELIAGINS